MTIADYKLFKSSFIGKLLNIKFNVFESNNINYTEIIHNRKSYITKSATKHGISRGCCEYLVDEEVKDDKIILPIPIRYTFPETKDVEEKKNKIIDYINYLNSTNLFTYNIVKDNNTSVVLNKYMKLASSHNYIKENYDFIEYLIENKINDVTFNNAYFDTIIHESKFDKFIKLIKPLLYKKFGKLIDENQTGIQLNINKECMSRDTTGYRWYNYIIEIYNKNTNGLYIPTYMMISKDKVITDFKLYKCRSVMHGRYITPKSSFILNIKRKYFNTKELYDLFNYINILYHSFLKEEEKDKTSIITHCNNKIKYIKSIIKYNKRKVKSSFNLNKIVKDLIKDDFVFVEIDGSNLNINSRRGNLVHLTLIRYLFYSGFNHIPDIILRFRDNIKDITLLQNLVISSNFHKGDAWHRYNIIDSLHGYGGSFEEHELTINQLLSDSEIMYNLKHTTKFINKIFTNSKYEIIIKNKNKIETYNILEGKLKENNYEFIYNFFLGTEPIPHMIICLSSTFTSGLTINKEYRVVSETKTMYLVLNDRKKMKYYKKTRFK